VASYQVDSDGRRRWQGDISFLAPEGGSTEPWIGQVHPADAGRLRDAVEQARRQGSAFVTYRARGKGSPWVWIGDRLSCVVADPAGRATAGAPTGRATWSGVCWAGPQATELNRDPITDHLPAVTYLYDFSSQSFLDVNQYGLTITGTTRESLFETGRGDLTRLMHPDDAAYLPRHLRRMERLADGDAAAVAFRMRRADGSFAFLSGRETVFARTPEGRPWIVLGAAQDSSDNAAIERELLRSVLYDALTGLPNRTLFQERLDQALRLQQRSPDRCFAILLLELDRFQIVNEALGLAGGDQVLLRAGRRLEECLQEGDTVARFGGDEFVVLLEGVRQRAQAAAAAARIRQALSAPFTIGSSTVHINASVGVAISQPPGRPAHELIREAEAALARAKSAGGGAFRVYERRMQSHAAEELLLDSELRAALDRDEFTLLFQPICSVPDRSVRSFEALLRWKHPSRGLLPPGEFLANAGITGLIVPIGNVALEMACRQLAAWRDLPEAASVSVNIDGRQFSQPDLALRIAGLIGRYELKPSRLRLEVTETVIMENLDTVAGQLDALRNLGVPVLLDDFGIGFSSLGRLRRFPIDTLKIDRSFIDGLDTDSENAEIVRAILTLARNLGMTTVAEGVESYPQLQALERAGCDFGQGFFFHPPLPHDAAAKLLVPS
jgi:diguanylate cyclase (GGDEF)-like protein